MFQKSIISAGLLFVTCLAASGQTDDDQTVINSEFNRVFIGNFVYEITDVTDMSGMFEKIETELKSLTLGSAGTDPKASHVEILKYKKIAKDNLLVTFRLTFKSDAKVSRTNLIHALNGQTGISKATIYAAQDPQERTESNKRDAYEKAEKDIVRYMNRSVSPCHDFYEYACGNFETVHKNDAAVDSAWKLIETSALDVLQEFFKRKPTRNQPLHDRIAHQFYATCTRFFESPDYYMEQHAEDYMNNIIKQLGDLPMMDKDWKEKADGTTPTAADVLAYLQIVQGITTGLVELSTEIDHYPSDPNDKRHVVTVWPPTVSKLQPISIEDIDETQKFQFEVLIDILTSVKKEWLDYVQTNGWPQEGPVPALEPKYDVLGIPSLLEAYKNVFLKYTNDKQIETEPEKILIDPMSVIYIEALLRKMGVFPAFFDEKTLRNYYLTKFIKKVTDEVELNKGFNTIENATERAGKISTHCGMQFLVKMGLIADRIYVDEFFSIEGDEKMKNLKVMFANLKESYSQLLDSDWWLDEPTRTLLKDKVNNMDGIMAYSDHLLEDNFLDNNKVLNDIPKSASYLEMLEFVNVWKKVNKFQQTGEYSKKLRDLTLSLNTWLVNAHFERENLLVMHAGFLHEPIYQTDAVMKAIEYGFGGFILAHEMGHAFDNDGYKYDQTGKWEVDHYELSERTKIGEFKTCLIKQYDAYCPYENGSDEDNTKQCVNGKVTLKDNIPDVLGVHMSYKAYKALNLAPHRFNGLLADKSPEEIFFLTYAQGWCGKMNKEYYDKYFSRLDPHSPLKYRVNGPLKNIPAFGDAFNCPKNSEMTPEKYCKVWT